MKANAIVILSDDQARRTYPCQQRTCSIVFDQYKHRYASRTLLTSGLSAVCRSVVLVRCQAVPCSHSGQTLQTLLIRTSSRKRQPLNLYTAMNDSDSLRRRQQPHGRPGPRRHKLAPNTGVSCTTGADQPTECALSVVD